MRPGFRSVLSVALLAAIGSITPVRAGGIDPGDITFLVTMGDCGLTGWATPGSIFRVIVHDRSDAKVLDQTVTTNPSGTWHADCIEGRFRGGEHITARFGDALRRLFVVPRLSLVIDRDLSVARGVGPTSSPASVQLIIDACVPGLLTCRGGSVDVDVATDTTTGAWEHPLAPFDTDGADNARVVWTSTLGDVTLRRARTPYLEVRAGSARISGFGRPGVPLAVTLRSRSGAVRATARATPAFPYSGWTATFRRHGRRVRVRVGDRVGATFATDASLRVRDIPIAPDLATGQVHGSCRPGGEYGVRWVDHLGAYQGQDFGVTDPVTGAWTIAVPGIGAGWNLTAWCDDAAGDVVRRVFVVP